MQENLIFIIPILTLLVGIILAYFFTKFKFEKETSALTERTHTLLNEKVEKENSISELQKSINLIRNEKEYITIELTKKESEFNNLQNKLEEHKSEVENLQEKFSKDFEILASKILEEKSQKFTIKNKENIEQILNPLQEKIKSFEKKVEDTHKESIDRQSALREQIIGLSKLNEQMSKEAVNLTKALKGDSKVQGNWGELVLERVLEKSGLEKGREYEMEKSFNIDEGNHQRLRPDVIIHLPDNKKMIVDSKVSLTAYEQFVNAEDENKKKQYLKDHISSLNRHVTQLSEKKYEDLYKIESPDFVLLFIPIEPAFALAINQDNQLYNKAFEKNIVIVTPSTLLATLRTIDSMWNNEKQQKNAIEIAQQAGRLYDQFVNLTNDLIKVGNQLKTVQGSYEGTMKKLTGQGNLIKKVENLKQLGAKASKQFNEDLKDRAIEVE
ncbi:MAG: DNA recombination protein RmuC [Flavobacteriaceae bacterium]|nr:DNA recombination protein RmuC [Flavobacteriaceae bacterium]